MATPDDKTKSETRGAPNTDRDFPTDQDKIQTISGVPDSAAPVPVRHDELPPVIDQYHLVRPIGEGGMGSVWLAEQTSPVTRQVALKVIKKGLDSRHVIARFEAERQALAMMDHPNIAKILDAGSTESGQPYFVMEYIDGQPITKFCDANALPNRQRIELFCSVCRAVQHAHQKGIIHRDIKPSNILVSTHDDSPQAKVIDFGLAKAIHTPLTDKTVETAYGAPLGTLIYASPEQAEGNVQLIDTRSDVYSLGVTLYELIAGSTPVEFALNKDASAREIARLICDEEPPKPSSRLSSSGARLDEISSLRGTKPHQLTVQVRGDLDWIVMKAIDRDRDNRYQSVGELADEIERFLTNQPVLAGPPNLYYRAKKYVARHRVFVGSMTALLALLLTTTVASISVASAIGSKNRELVTRNDEIESLLEERDRQNRVVTRQNEALQDRATRIENLAVLANNSIGAFLVDATQDPRMIGPSGSNVRRARLLQAQDILNQVAELAPDGESDLVRAKTRLYGAISDAELGNLEAATDQLSEAIDLLDAAPPSQETTLFLAQAYRNLGYFEMKKGRLKSAGEAHAMAIEVLAETENPGSRIQLELAISLTYRGETMLELEDYQTALEDFVAADRNFTQLLDADFPKDERLWSDTMYFSGMNKFNMAIAYEFLGKDNATRQNFLEAVERYDQLIEQRPDQPRNHSRRTRAYLNLATDMIEASEVKTSLRVATAGWESSQALTQYPHVLEYQFQIARAEFVLGICHYNADDLVSAGECGTRGLAQIERMEQRFDSLDDFEDLIRYYESFFVEVAPAMP